MTTVHSSSTTLDRFIELTERKRELEKELRMLKDQLAPLEDDLLDELAQRGESAVRHAATGRLVSIRRQIWARAANGKPAACAALADVGLSEYVEETFNTHSLSAYYRELATQRRQAGQPVTDLEQLLAPRLRGVIALTEDHRLSVT
jgi:hypothetical protein